MFALENNCTDEIIGRIKKQSSKWIKSKGQPYSDFYWQNGYGMFSVNPRETNAVVDYIINQEAHHKKITFQNEFRAFLKNTRLNMMNAMCEISFFSVRPFRA